MTSAKPRPGSLPRRFERWLIGVMMAVGAYFIEKLVMRSIRKEGGSPKPDTGTPMQSKGSTIQS